MMKKFLPVLALVALSGQVMAGPETGRPNIIAAHEHAQQAIEKLKAAQAANEYDLGGHAAKAERLLRQAEEEMKRAAEVANLNHKR